jgi:ribosome-binding ATPase
MFKISLFGYSGSGKTGLFKAVTGNQEESYDPSKPNISTGIYKDKNLSRITEIHKARKVIYPEFEFCDFKGYPADTGFPDGYFRNFFESDAIVCVVNNFADDAHPERDASSLLMEMIFYDTERIQKILNYRQENVDSISPHQTEVLKKGLGLLEGEHLLNEMDAGEKETLHGIELITTKAVIVYINGASKKFSLQTPYCLQHNALSNEDLGPFYKMIMQQLSLITFYTIKGDIARGWLIPAHYAARQAAGSVHKDMERGFIKAAVVSAEDLFEAGSWQAAKNAGMLKFLGSDSKLSDGDIVEFYFTPNTSLKQ